jgi:hypothetical protein
MVEREAVKTANPRRGQTTIDQFSSSSSWVRHLFQGVLPTGLFAPIVIAHEAHRESPERGTATTFIGPNFQQATRFA